MCKVVVKLRVYRTTRGEDLTPPDGLKLLFSVYYDGNVFHVGKLKAGVLLEHT